LLVDFIPALTNGEIDAEQASQKLAQNDYDLVSVMHSNNETGVVQPIE